MCELCRGHEGLIEIAEEDGWRMAPCPNGCVSWLSSTDRQDATQDEDDYERAVA